MASVARKKSGAGGWLLFWLTFIIGITLLFMFNLERIKATLEETGVLDRLLQREPALVEHVENTEDAPADGTEGGPAAVPVPDTVQSPPAITQTGPPDTADPAEKPPAQPAAGQKKPVERNVYLLRVDNAGTILQTKVKRSLPASDSPLRDAIEVLIRGPGADESKNGLISLIPGGTRLLGATVRGTTAYLNFNEEFLFNEAGVEGYAGQRRQVVLTATEFANVKDVQILIDGKRQDYLGEGIWIGSPISKDML
ncbi:MAG: GerMN domain-containing protein [Treponema sp.]|jgi:spore germination protein GerM|nr:GerMN domain-containing protein [Treponema sp.]